MRDDPHMMSGKVKKVENVAKSERNRDREPIFGIVSFSAKQAARLPGLIPAVNRPFITCS